MSNLQLTIDVLAADAASSVMQNIARSISNIGGPAGVAASAVLAIGTAVVGLGATAVSMAGQFQAGMTTLVTGAGEAQSNIAMVSQGILQLSTDTATSTDQLTKGMYMIESAGYHGGNGLNVLKVAAQGAKVGNADLGVTANALTTILTDYHMKSSDAALAMNALTATVANGKTHLQDLASSMGSVLPLASSLGISFPQVAGALATMTNSGMDAQRASMNLANAIRSLAAPNSAATKSMAAVGLSAQQLKNTLSTQGLTGAIQLVSDAVGKKFPAGSVQAVDAFKKIMGGATGYNVALMLGGKNMAAYQQAVDKITGAIKGGGNAVTGWANIQDSFNFKAQQAQQALNVLMITIGSKLLPVIGQLLSWLTPIITGFANWVAGGMQVNGTMQQIGTVLSALFLPIWQQLVNLFNQQLVPLWGQIQTAIAPLMPQLKALALLVGGILYGAFITVIVIIRAFVGLLAGVLSGVGLIIQGISTFIQGWLQFTQSVTTFFLDLVTGRWNKLGTDLQNIWGGIVKMFQGVWQAIVGVFTSAINGLIGMVNGFVQGIVSGINTILTATGHAAIQVGQIPMINGFNVAGGNFGGAFAPVATGGGSGSGGGKGGPQGPIAVNQAILAQLKAMQTQQAAQAAAAQAQSQQQNNAFLNGMAGSSLPAAGATTAASGKAGKSAASLLKQQQAAQAAAARLSADQTKALTTSNSPAVQALVNQSKAAAASGNMAMAQFYAQQANQLASSQKSATKAAASQQKAQQNAQAAAARLSTTQTKALTDSNTPAVQALVNQSKAAAASGNMAMAKVYASQALTLAASQKHATTAAQHKATAAAHKAQSAQHHQQVLAAATARKAQAAQHHQQVLAAQAARKSAAAQHHQQVLATSAARKAQSAQQHKATLGAHAARLSQAATHHKHLVETIQNATNQITNSQCPDAAIMATAAGVALPDYGAQTGYVQKNPQPQSSITGGGDMHIHVHLDNDHDADDDRRARKIADSVKRELAKQLRGQGNTPRLTSGGH